MLAATYAKSIGRTVAFSLAAFRQCFGAARPVDEEDTILLAAAACEMHPRAVLQALEMKSTQQSLTAAGAALRETSWRPHRAAGADRPRRIHRHRERALRARDRASSSTFT